MIKNNEQLRQAVDQLERMYRALVALRAEVLPQNPQQFALMSEGPLDEIQHLQEQINAYTGFTLALENDADVWLRIQGRSVEWSDVPTSVLTMCLDAFRKGIQAIAQFISTGQIKTRPTTELKRACDLRVAAFLPGSLCIGLRLPDETHLGLRPEPVQSFVHKALVEYLVVASWVSSEEDLSLLEQRIEDDQKRRILLNALKPLVPRPRGDVESVEISGRFVPDKRTICLTRHARQRIDQAIDWTVAKEQGNRSGDRANSLRYKMKNLGRGEEVKQRNDEHRF